MDSVVSSAAKSSTVSPSSCSAADSFAPCPAPEAVQSRADPPARRSAAVSPYGGSEERLVEDEPSARTHVPASPRGPGVVVDLDDDDPVFDDLEYYEPVVYRRAAGQ